MSVSEKLRNYCVSETGECQVVGQSATNRVNTSVNYSDIEIYMLMCKRAFFVKIYIIGLILFPLELPPLRQRIEDIELLLSTFIQKFTVHYHLPADFSGSLS
ncbi:MAG: hypothetical protein R3E08_04965 [Thiotrichaceae bacterium]